MANIVLTLASNYDFEVLRPFFESLYKTGYTDRCTLFLGEHDPETYQLLIDAFPIEIVKFKDEYPYFVDRPDLIEFLRIDQNSQCNPKSLRYLLYEAYLKKEVQNANIEFILGADSRDVVFQKDPFDFDKKPTLYVFQENTAQKIEENQHTSYWIREGFGEDSLKKLSHFPIICSGVTIGSCESYIAYLACLNEYILKTKDIGGMDQGIHNYLIYNNILKNVTIVPDDTGAVSTISSFKPTSKININKKNLVLDKNDEPINIVHQYDRLPKLLKHYSKRNYRIQRIGKLKKKYYFLVKPFKT